MSDHDVSVTNRRSNAYISHTQSAPHNQYRDIQTGQSNLPAADALLPREACCLVLMLSWQDAKALDKASCRFSHTTGRCGYCWVLMKFLAARHEHGVRCRITSGKRSGGFGIDLISSNRLARGQLSSATIIRYASCTPPLLPAHAKSSMAGAAIPASTTLAPCASVQFECDHVTVVVACTLTRVLSEQPTCYQATLKAKEKPVSTRKSESSCRDLLY